jgi:hypothetical protein
MKLAILDVAGGDKPTQEAGDGAARFIRRGSVVANMAWNLLSAIQQPLGVSLAIPRLGVKYIGKAISKLYGSAKQYQDTVDWIESKSSFMKDRSDTMTRELSEVKNSVAAKTRFALYADKVFETLSAGNIDSSDVYDSFYFFQRRAQSIPDQIIWTAAYMKAMDEMPEDTIAEEAEEKAIQLANQEVADSQGSGMVKDRARVERGAGWAQIWTALYSYMSVALNNNIEAIKKPQSVGRMLSDLLMINTVPVVGSMIVFNLMRGDRDDDDGIFTMLAKEHLAYLVGQVLILREAQGMIKGYGDYTGPAGASMLTNVIRSIGLSMNRMDPDSRKFLHLDASLIRALNKAAGSVFQYPATQIDRTARGLADLLEGMTVNPLAPLLGPAVKR